MEIIDLVSHFKPIVYIPTEGPDRRMIDVLCELKERYAILWYHWPKDGYNPLQGSIRHDYEPVVLAFKNDQLVSIGLRPHRRYQRFKTWDWEGDRPVVVFTTAWHGALIGGGGTFNTLVRAFTSSNASERIDEYSLIYQEPPTWFGKDGTNTDVHDFADQLVAEATS